MRSSLSKRLVALSVLLSLILMGSYLYCCISDIDSALVEQKSQDIRMLLERTADYVNLYCEGLSTNLLTFSSTLSMLNEADEGKIQQLINSFHDTNPGKVLTTALVLSDGTCYSNRATAMEIFGNHYFVTFSSSLANEKVRVLHWSEPYTSPLTLTRTIALYKAIAFCGGTATVIAELNLNTMLSSILNAANDPALTWSVISKEGQLVATSDDYSAIYSKYDRPTRETLEKNLQALGTIASRNSTCTIDGTEYLAFQRKSAWDWTLTVLSETSSLYAYARPFLVNTLWIGILHLMVLSLLLWMIGHFYTRSLVQMAKKIKNAHDPLRIVLTEFTHKNDEVGILAKNIEELIGRIHSLTKEREQSMQQQRQLEIDVLQGQIHPHFLCNTLACIQSFIKDGLDGSALSSITSLIKLMNYSISRKDSTATLADELACAESYVTLRKLRVTYSFSYHVHVAPNHLQHQVPRLILQPIIENSIVHGFAGSDIQGKIVVASYVQNGKLFLSVSDNGQGASQDRLNAVMKGDIAPSERSHGIGLGNVFKRLMLNDPSQNHSAITPGAGGGVRVILDLGSFQEGGEFLNQ